MAPMVKYFLNGGNRGFQVLACFMLDLKWLLVTLHALQIIKQTVQAKNLNSEENESISKSVDAAEAALFKDFVLKI